MTVQEKNYAALILAWSRTLEKHGLMFEEWLRRAGK